MGPLLKKRGLGCDVSSRLGLGLGPTWDPREARPCVHFVAVSLCHIGQARSAGRDTLSH